jgi:hypothetical protein
VETAGEQIAGFIPGFGSVGKANALQHAGGFAMKSGDRPATCPIRSFSESGAVADALPDLCGVRPERDGEGRKLHKWRLLGDAGYVRSVLLEVNGYGEKQWTGACYCDTLASHGESAFDERLEAACSKDPGEGPARKGQESLARAGGEDEAVVVQGDDLGFALGFASCLAKGLEGSGSRCVEDAAAEEKFCSGFRELMESASFPCVFCVVRVLAGSFDAAAPDLSSGCGVVVEQEHTSPVTGCSGGGSDAGWSGAHDDDFSMFHRSDSTTMPSLQIN